MKLGKVKEEQLPLERVKELLNYNPETGMFTWRIDRYRVKAGTVAGHLNEKGYYSVRTNKKHHLLHRLAWLYVTGKYPKNFVDHVNGDKTDNRFENLREATKSQNGMNTNIRCTNTSGFKGVSYHKASGKWVAQAKLNYKHYYLGIYPTAEEASAVYNDFVKTHHKEFYKNTAKTK